MISKTLKFKDILLKKDGIVKGPFGGDIKKAYFVQKGLNTYKVYEQGVVYNKDIKYGTYYINEERYNLLKKFTVKSGDLLITGAGTLGEMFEIPSDYEQGIINQALIRIRVNEEIVNKEYFKYYFKYFIREIACRINGDSVIPNLPPLSILKELDIFLPDIFFQQNISNFLSSIDKKIENNNKINQELESMAKTIYDYWFLQFDFPDENGNPYKSSGGKMVWNEELNREIPAGWEVKQFENLTSLSNGINYDKNDIVDKKYKIVNVRNMTASSLIINDDALDEIDLKSSQAQKYLVKNNDILIARSGTPGATRLLFSSNKDIVYCGFIINCSPYNIQQRYYITYVLKTYEGSNLTKTGGSIMQNVSQETLKQIKICVPPNDLLCKFNKIIDLLFSKIKDTDLENNELKSLRDFLLPLLMNGQVGFKE